MSDQSFDLLFSPIDIAGMPVQNRVMLTTHNPKMSEQRYLDYLRTRVSGGVGMVGIPVLHEGISTLSYVSSGALDPISAYDVDGYPDPETQEGQAFFDELLGPMLAARAKIVHDAGARAFGQLANRGSIRLPESFQPMLSPSGIRDPQVRTQPLELTADEIRRVAKLFGRSAQRIKDAGFDGAEIHAAHNYLVEQFLSPSTNRRTDEYGGSLENRARFLRDIIEQIREQCGDDYPIGLRISGHQATEGGLSVDDVAATVALVDDDLAYVNVTAGSIMALQDGVGLPYVASTYYQPGFNADCTTVIKQATDKPVILTGRMNDPALMEQVLAEGICDMVGVTRTLIADPEFLTKVRQGRADEVHKCIGINECHYPDRVSACPVNPSAGRENELRIVPVTNGDRRHVLVVGGGPAGLMAARTAVRRGHRVTLVEKGQALGGKVDVLRRDPLRREMANLVGDLVRECTQQGVEFDMGTEADADYVARVGADTVVVATGSVPVVPDLPGLEDVRTFTALDILVDASEVGDRVLVVGGLNDHVAPLAAADYLADRGKEVVLISECLLPGQGAEPSILHKLTKHLLEKHVRVEALTELVCCGPEPMVRNTFSKETSALGRFDSIVFAADSAPVGVDGLDGGNEVHRIGDALAPRRLVHATLDGMRIGTRV